LLIILALFIDVNMSVTCLWKKACALNCRCEFSRTA